MFDNPPTPYYSLLITPCQQKVYRVALPIGIPSAYLRVGSFDGLQEECAQVLSVLSGHAQRRREETCFVLPLIMHGVQAVVAQLANIDNRTLYVWNGHTIRFVSVKHVRLGPLVCPSPYAICLHKLPAWDTGYIPTDVAVIVKAHG